MTQYLTFQLGEELYASKLTQAKEIIKPRKITDVPNTEEHILGVINLRGQIVPVLNLKKRLGLKSNGSKDNSIYDEEEQRIIIGIVNNVFTGVLVDSVKGVVKVNDEEIEKVAANEKTINNEYVKGVIQIDKKLLIIIDLDKITCGREVE